jgi:ureidoglycolate lyase
MNERKVKKVKVQKLTPEAMRPFGKVIGPQTGGTLDSDPLSDYWDDAAGLSIGKDTKISYWVIRSRAFRVAEIERHVKTQRMYIPLKGTSIFVFAPGREKADDPDALPSIDEIQAFLMDGTSAVVLDPGVWNWIPLPLTETATFLLLLKRGVSSRNIGSFSKKNLAGSLQVVDLVKTFGIELELSL